MIFLVAPIRSSQRRSVWHLWWPVRWSAPARGGRSLRQRHHREDIHRGPGINFAPTAVIHVYIITKLCVIFGTVRDKLQEIEARVEITAAHMGYMEFRLCANNDVTTEATQECLDQTVLRDRAGNSRFINYRYNVLWLFKNESDRHNVLWLF